MKEAETKRDMILDAAIKVFAEKGYHACRTRDITREAGVGYGSLYHYFTSKDEVLYSIFRERWSFFLNHIDRVNQTKLEPIEKLLSIFGYVFKSYQKAPNAMRVLVTEVPLLRQLYTEENLALYFDRFHIAVADIIREGQSKGIFRENISPQLAAIMVQGTIDMMVRQHINNPHLPKVFSVEDAKEQFVNILEYGLLKEKDGQDK